MKKPVPILRGDHYYLRRRVPARYAPVDQRTFVQICLFTDSLVIAERTAAEVWAQMVDAWEAKLDGATDEADARMAAARNLAQRRGYRYLGAPEVARLPIEELLRRIESVVDKRGRLDMRDADAALGLAPAPAMTVSQAFEEFYKVAGDRIVGKSADQMRRHKAPRLKATNNFIAAVGNKQLAEIDPPPLKWSAVMFRKRRIENGKQATDARGDCLEVAAG